MDTKSNKPKENQGHGLEKEQKSRGSREGTQLTFWREGPTETDVVNSGVNASGEGVSESRTLDDGRRVRRNENLAKGRVVHQIKLERRRKRVHMRLARKKAELEGRTQRDRVRRKFAERNLETPVLSSAEPPGVAE